MNSLKHGKEEDELKEIKHTTSKSECTFEHEIINEKERLFHARRSISPISMIHSIKNTTNRHVCYTVYELPFNKEDIKIIREDDEEVFLTDYLVKTILIGDAGVGKSTFVKCIRNNKEILVSSYFATIGVEFEKTKFKFIGDALVTNKNESREKIIKLHIWDTAGQERFRSITKQYYKTAANILLFFDVGSYKTFEHLYFWLDEIQRNVGLDNVNISIIGNKVDTIYREVSTEEANKFAKILQMNYYECTIADTNYSQNILYQEAMRTLLKKNKIQTGISTSFELNEQMYAENTDTEPNIPKPLYTRLLSCFKFIKP